jgi:hypothetical protein
MATTTNYGWTTPDDTALVKDGASAIRTLGSSVDTTTKALNPSTTLGDIEYRSSTANTNTRLGIGSTGNVLTVAGGVPTWAAPAGGGKVLQVVQATYATQLNTSSATYVDTNLTATITPTSATSKVLVLITQSIRTDNTTGSVQSNLNIMRGATQVFEQVRAQYNQLAATGLNVNEILDIVPMTFLDSPNTTSATTYKTQVKLITGTNVQLQGGSSNSVITLMEIGA